MTEQELMDSWWNEFERVFGSQSHIHPGVKRLMFAGFLMAKRSQPVVVLPKPATDHYHKGEVNINDVMAATTRF